MNESLKVVRHYYGMSQSKFSKEIGITQSKLSKIENGEVELSEDSIKNIDGFLPVFFNRNHEIPAQQLYYRKLSSVSKSMVSMFESRMLLLLDMINHLTERIEIPENKLPSIDAEDFQLDFENIAQEVRIALKTPRGSISNLISLLERNGVIVHFFDYNFITESNRKFDGVSTYMNGVPVILVNNKIPNSRKVFTIAHELGHLVMHFDYIINPDRDIEDEANKFAFSFLAPVEDVKKEFKRFNLDKLFKLKSDWKMSAAAILYRAREIGNIDNDWYRKCITWLSNYRKKEPYEFDIEKPSLLKMMIDLLQKETDFSFVNTLGLERKVSDELLGTIYPKESEIGMKLILTGL